MMLGMAKARDVKRREENEVEFSRIVAFSDGVFAIAITLLVLNLSVPANLHGKDLTDALWDQRHNLSAYALSFAVIGRFWVVHHRFFGELVGFDGKLIALNLFYLSWIVLIPFSSQVLGDHGGDTAALVVYAANLGAVTLIGMWMTSDARREGLAKTPPHTAEAARQRALFISVVFLASIPVAFINPRITPYLWLALLIAALSRHIWRRSAAG
jgi:TMEM175 potassium channel family protein